MNLVLMGGSGPQILCYCHCCVESRIQGQSFPIYHHDNRSELVQTLLPSPRNSIEGLLSLLDATKCSFLASAPEAKVDHILEQRTMQHHIIKTFDDWLATESVAHYPYKKAFEEAAHDPFIVIHTSGSTGLPKPVTLTQGGLATVDAQHLMPPSNGYLAQVAVPGARGPETIFSALPPFHVRRPLPCPHLLIAHCCILILR